MLLYRLLPVYDMSETSVKIKVQHDSNIHQGICAQNCPNQHGSRHQSKVYNCTMAKSITKCILACIELYHTFKLELSETSSDLKRE